MTKPQRKPLSTVLAAEAEQQNVAPVGDRPTPPDLGDNPRQSGRTSREGMKIVSGWFPQTVGFELEELRLERSRAAGRKVTLQELQAEAYNDLFKKYGRPELAPVSGGVG